MSHRDVGKQIVSVIRADAQINKLIGGRIIPVTSDEPIKTPYIAYRRVGTEYSEYKQYSVPKSVNIEIAIVSDTYVSGVQIADMMDDLFPKIVDSDEGYIEGVGYVQKIIVNLKV